jgi:hypothetical protein
MLSRYYRGLGRQNGVMMLHGIGAATAIAILFYYSAFELNTEVPYASIFFFTLAVFGGLFMAFWDKVVNKKMPKHFPLFHAGAAVAGFLTLAYYVFFRF